MTHWRTMTDSDWLRCCDLMGREATVRIIKVVGGIVVGEGGLKKRKPILHFEGKSKPFAISSTDGKTLESLYGADVEGWVGKWITLYPTTTERPGQGTVACIRVRPTIPKPREGKSAGQPPSDTNGGTT